MKVIVFCCDVYAGAAPAWLDCQRTNWADCPYEVEFVTNSKRLSVDVPVHYFSGDELAYGWRVRQFIQKKYIDDLILISMADYFIKSSNQTIIAQAEALCHQKSVRHVRLRPMPPPPLPLRVTTKHLQNFGRIDKRLRYSLSLQPGIWETQVLYDLCRDNEDPWQTEILGSRRARAVAGDFLSTTKHVLPHINYYRKGGVSKKTKQWVRQNVGKEFWPGEVADDQDRSTN